MQKRRTQEERRTESERKIVDAAIELFALQGYIKTTLNQVGEQAGYTGGLISSRFGSKENLLKAVLLRISNSFLNEQAARLVDPDDTKGSLHRFVNAYLTDVSRKKSSVRALYVVMGEALGAVSEAQQEIAEFNALTRENLAAIIRQGVDTGQVPGAINPAIAALLILALIRGVTQQYLADPQIMRVSEAIDQVNAMIDDYLWAGDS